MTIETLTTAEAARTLGLKRRSVCHAIARGTMAARKTRGRYSLTQEGVEAYRRAHLGKVGGARPASQGAMPPVGHLRVAQAARMAGVSPQALYDKIARGTLPSIKAGGIMVVPLEAVRDMIDQDAIGLLAELHREGILTHAS